MSYAMHLAGWVVLQSTWQTLVVALLLVCSLRLARRAPASRRYHCAVLHLVGAAGAVVLTLAASHASVALTPPLASAGSLREGWLPRLEDQTGGIFPVLGLIWLGGVAVVQLLLAVRLLRLRGFLRSSHPAPQDVSALVEVMCRAAGLSRFPRVLCADVGSPMVAGERPAVLVVPRAFGEAYPQSEMRALLAHELAHIVRRDYSRNLLQLLALSLLWWHPGAWVIYARIRHERECTCDEYALQHACSRTSLARALFHLAEAPITTEVAAAAAGCGGLTDRVSRLAEPGEHGGRKTVPRFLAAGFAALAATIIGASSIMSRSESITRAYASSAAAPNVVFTIHAQDPGGSFLVKMVRGRVVAIELEQQPVPSDRVVQHGDMVMIMGAAGQEMLRIEVDPRGGLRWRPRRAS